jgi:hypothetical protein
MDHIISLIAIMKVINSKFLKLTKRLAQPNITKILLVGSFFWNCIISRIMMLKLDWWRCKNTYKYSHIQSFQFVHQVPWKGQRLFTGIPDLDSLVNPLAPTRQRHQKNNCVKNITWTREEDDLLSHIVGNLQPIN